MQRICVELAIDTPSGVVRVMTTHLEYYSALQRAAQVEALRSLYQQAASHARSPREGAQSDATFVALPRGVSTIVCGDFNFKPDDPEHARISAPHDDATPRLVDAWHVANTGVPHAATVGLHECEWPDEPYCCDFVFVSENLAPRIRALRVNQRTDASDHQPLALIVGD
jgi:endonuclease/exonuclease/phosphatase family metal-dependent hydrolase